MEQQERWLLGAAEVISILTGLILIASVLLALRQLHYVRTNQLVDLFTASRRSCTETMTYVIL